MSMLEFIGEIGRAEKIHRKPHIPRDKAYNAISSYCPSVNYDDIEILIDETVFGNAKIGIIVTADEICGKDNFCDPFRYALPKVSSLFIKKSLMASTLYINEREVIKLTQPSGATLVHLFSKVEQYLRQMQHASKPEQTPTPAPQPSAPQPQVKFAEPTKSILESPRTLPDDSVAEPVLVATPQEDKKTASKFRRWPKDNLITSIQSDKHLNSVFNFIGDVLSDSKSSKSATLRREVSGFLAKSILRLRKDYIDRNQLTGLMNDIATLELAIYSIAYLRLELTSRRVDSRLISYTLTEGVKAFLSLDNATSSRNLLDNLLHLAEAMGDSVDDITFSFYMRMVMSNMKGSLADDELEISQLRGVAEFNEELPFEDALHQLIQEIALGAASEIGDISTNRHIGYDAQRCADNVIDLY